MRVWRVLAVPSFGRFAHMEGLCLCFSHMGLADAFLMIQDYLLQLPVLRIGSNELDAYILFFGNFLGWVLLIYPTETLRPGWLNWKRALLELLPMAAFVALDYWVPIDLRWIIALYPAVLIGILVSQTSQMVSSPTYQFRSTSVYAPSMEHNASFVPLADQTANGPRNGRIRKGGFDEEENEIGVVDNPIGDVAWGAIFLCAALYLALRALRRKKGRIMRLGSP